MLLVNYIVYFYWYVIVVSRVKKMLWYFYLVFIKKWVFVVKGGMLSFVRILLINIFIVESIKVEYYSEKWSYVI